MPRTLEGTGSAAGLRFAVIRSRFNEDITKRLLEGALRALRAGGVQEEAIDVVFVPGAFEIPPVASRLARSRRYGAIICVGAVIKGETPHFEYISSVVSQGIARAAYEHDVPIIFGVLTTDTVEQAEARSGGGRGLVRDAGSRAVGVMECNRGYEAGQAALEMANLMRRLPGKRMGKASTRKKSR